jgi:hypothetical protein
MALEYDALRELASALETQLALETQAADAWRQAFLEQEALLAALMEQNKSERRKGFVRGVGAGAAAAVLLGALL